MMDKATGRVVAVIVLLIAIAASLRGYLPGVEHAGQQRPPQSGFSLLYVAALLTVSLVIVAVALIARLRDPRRVASSAAPLSDRFSGGRGRPAWRVLMIGAAVLVVWLILVWLLSQFVGPHGIDQSQSAPQSAVPAPANNVPRPPGQQDNGADRDMLRYLIASTVALLAMIVAGAIVARRRRAVEPSSSAPLPNRRADFCRRGLLAGAGGRKRFGRDRGPQSRTAAGDHRVLCGDGTRTAAFPRSCPAGFRHSDRGSGPRRRTPRVARRQCS